MKKLISMMALFLMVATAAFSQEKKRELTVEEAAGKNQMYYDDGDYSLNSPNLNGNIFIFNWGIIYRVDRLPAYSIGAGMQFSLSKRIGVECGATLINSKISTDEKFTGSTDVVEGSTTYTDVDLMLKIFATKIFWIGTGVVYETLLDGYYVDRTGAGDIYTPLTKEDDPNKIAFKLAFGLLSPIGKETYATPSIHVRYNIPLDPKFKKTNIYAGVSFGIALNLGEVK